MEAKNQGSGEEDHSMEEILQSIRRIIADDGEEVKPAAAADAAASDVLELTDMLPDDAPAAEAKAESGDVLGKIDAALAPEPAPLPEPTMTAAEPAPSGETLLSPATEKATLAALDKLKIPEPETPRRAVGASPAFRSGQTVEDMVEEMLKPMMKDWLNSNLPAIVERIVDREVRRLTRPA